MSAVKLVSVTQPQIKKQDSEDFLSPEELITYCARVSNPNNQLNTETAPKLLKFCINHKHWSIFEQVDFSVEIKTSRAIAAQIIRHRNAFFQEFCMSGDMEIYFDPPAKVKKNKFGAYKLTLEEIYNKWNDSRHGGPLKRDRLKNMHIRIYNEDTLKFEHSHIKNVFYTGIKDIYKITLANGKFIKCTKEHKVLSKNGFVSLAEGCGLNHTDSGKAYITNKDFMVACNGKPCHQDYEWLKKAKEESIKDKTGVKGIAKKAGVSYHTIRAWLRKLNLTFTPKEVSAYCPPWNKGKTGYSLPPHSLETIKKMRKSAKKGPDSNLWKGGVSRPERIRIADWCATIRAEKMIEYNYECRNCKSKKDLQLHHIVPVYKDKEKAYEKDNIEVLCKICHQNEHKINGDHKIWCRNRQSPGLTIDFSEIKKVEYLGKQKTYDLEIDHVSHNYVANGIVVHNSQRYSPVQNFEPVELRKQGKTNRQVGDEVFDPILMPEANLTASKAIDRHLELTKKLYNRLLDEGVAKECARMILPMSSESTLYMKNNVRNWIHYIELRTSPDTQKEHRDVAEEIKKIFVELFPNISEALEWKKASV